MHTSEPELKAWMVSGLGGDAAAHACLLRALIPLLRRFFRRRMPGQGAAIEDLIQETLIAVHTRRATYDPRRPITGWLFAIARYKMIDQFRASRRYCSIEGLEDMLVTDGFAEASDAATDIDRLLDDLSPKQAAVIRATRLEGLSVAETATRERIGESDVKISVHRGLRLLATRVKDSLR
jgi:RNA polymerase sigma factor (sigma-70 family)